MAMDGSEALSSCTDRRRLWPSVAYSSPHQSYRLPYPHDRDRFLMQVVQWWEVSWLQRMVDRVNVNDEHSEKRLTNTSEYICNTLTRLGTSLGPHQALFFRILLSFFLRHLPSGRQI